VRQQSPARGVVRVAREPGPELGRELRHLLLLDGERCRDGLARDVVRRAAEAAGDEHDVEASGRVPDEGGDRVELVRHGGDEAGGEAERLQPPR
jgi:hypothetical protein